MNLISIIIPHYNDWSRLKELLITIPKDPKIETIVIDDNSKNNDYNILQLRKEFDSVIFFKNTSSKKGAGAARNIGLQNATGKWILFADADDKFSPNLIEITYQYLNTDYDIVYFIPTSFSEENNTVTERHLTYEKYINKYIDNPNRINELKLRYYFFAPWSKLIRRNIIINNNISFDEVMVSNDVLFSTKIGFYSDKIYATNEQVYSIRKSDNSLTSIINEKRFRQRTEVWMRHINFIKKHLFYRDYKELNTSASTQIIDVIRYKLGIKNVLFVLKKCLEYDVALIDRRFFNIEFIKRRIKAKKCSNTIK